MKLAIAPLDKNRRIGDIGVGRPSILEVLNGYA
jgi:hypothetical protein